MPPHTTLDLATGLELGTKLAVRVSALNVFDSLYLTGLENSFAGTHYASPRELGVQLRYKFHY